MERKTSKLKPDEIKVLPMGLFPACACVSGGGESLEIMKYIFYLLLALVLISSCKKDELNELGSDIGTREYLAIDDTNMAYCFQHLDIVAKGLSGLSNNVGFKDILHNMIELQFDGDYNVLFNDLVDECNANSIDIINLMKVYLNSNQIDSSLLTQSLQAFNSIDGHTYYIQVYIPNIEDLSSFSSNTPISFAYYGDETKLTYDGFYAYNDELTTSTDIDEPYSEENEVWIISLNENVDDDGELITPIDPITGNPIPEVLIPIPPNNSSTVDAEIEKMTIFAHKERWPAGKSDVATRVMISYHDGVDNNYNPYFEYILGSNSYRGDLIKGFKRKWVKNSTEKTVNFQFANDWESGDYLSDRVELIMVVFERDVFPASKKKTPDFPLGSANHAIYFRSANTMYFAARLCSMDGYNQFYFDGKSFTTSEIKFNIKEQ
jgi:hypothetical protein